MAAFILYFCLLGQFAATALSTDFCDRDFSTLKQLIVVFRHGDRSPEGTFPTDEYQESFWPLGWGQLTSVGIKRHYLYGQWMRQCYKTFLNETLSPQRVFVRSSDVDRTLMSAQAHIAGAYPPKGNQTWGKNQNISLGRMWQPFPVHTVPAEEDVLLKANKNCKRYTELVEDAYNTTMVKKIEKDDAAILQYLGSNSGLNTTDLFTITRDMSDAVVIEMQKKLPLVDFLNKTYTDKLVFYRNLWFQLSFNDPQLAKLSGGPLLKTIVDDMVNRTKSGTTGNSLEHIIYSGHDTTVASILSSLGAFNNIAPPYTSTVIFELHQEKSGDYRVLVFYRNATHSEDPRDPFPISVENCTSSDQPDMGCSLSEFQEATSNKISATHSTDCLSGRVVPAAPLDLKTILIVVGVTSGLIILTVAIALVLKYLRRRPTDELLIEEDPIVN